MHMLRKLLVPAVALVAGLMLAGCAVERHEAIPASAQLQAEGSRELAFTAPHDGMAYVDNRDTDTLVWSGHVDKGQTVRIDTDRDRVSLDGQTLSDKRLAGGNYRIYFKRDDADRKVRVEHTETRIERRDRD